jgi:hypothetical protein
MKSSRSAYHDPVRIAPESAGNPHPTPDEHRLAQASERTLRDVIRLHRGRQVPSERLAAAGVPPLRAVLLELGRRQETEDPASTDPPTVEARCSWDRRGRYWKVVIPCCPHCGKTHWHGGGDGPVPDLGHRNAHCLDPRNTGYIIVAAEAESAAAS